MSFLKKIMLSLTLGLVLGITNFAVLFVFYKKYVIDLLSEYWNSANGNIILTVLLPIYIVIALCAVYLIVSLVEKMMRGALPRK